MKRFRTNTLGARVISGLLSLMMVMSACPISAFASEEIEDNTYKIVEIEESDENQDEDANVIIVDGEERDENLDAIPENETADDQTSIDVDTPPNIEIVENVADENDETTIVDESGETDEDAIGTEDGSGEETDVTDPTGEDTEETTPVDEETPGDEDPADEDAVPGEDETVPGEDEVPVDEDIIIVPVYNYSVHLNQTTDVVKVVSGSAITVSATVVATQTVGEEISDAGYTFQYSTSVEGNVDAVFDDSTSLTTNITLPSAGTYVIVGTVYDVDGNEVASDSITVEVEELPLVTFDHFYTDIDVNLVNTPDLLIQTADPSVFTKNTNVVSNFDDVYVISCGSIDEARYVYSYYVDKVTHISDMSNVLSIATDENPEDTADLTNLNDGNDAIANLNEIEITDYSGYIALIDTGADADVNFSVVGDDTSDTIGHGTNMLQYIKEENPNAKVMSIKVFNGSSTSAADVYAGIKLAIESNVSVINLSLVGANVEKNAIVKDVIQEALDRGIVVIGAAGNYNTDAYNFIPGCIEGVITVGAVDATGVKINNSNFNADLYVVANSTSEATARYTGMYTANNTQNGRVFNIPKDRTHDDKKVA